MAADQWPSTLPALTATRLDYKAGPMVESVLMERGRTRRYTRWPAPPRDDYRVSVTLDASLVPTFTAWLLEENQFTWFDIDLVHGSTVSTTPESRSVRITNDPEVSYIGDATARITFTIEEQAFA